MTDKHVHAWKLAYITKYNGEATAIYTCETCAARKEEKGEPTEIKRASGRGGKFSTSWRP